LEETLSKVHITNWVDALWVNNRSWDLAISVAPMMLNTLKMPLIHNSYNFLAFAVIDMREKIFISSINKDFFHLWEEDI